MPGILDYEPSDPGRSILQGLLIRQQMNDRRQRNQLLQQEQDRAEQQRNIQALGVFGQMLEGSRLEDRESIYQSGKAFFGNQGFDISDLPDQLDQNTYNQLLLAKNQAFANKGASDRAFAPITDPNTGEVIVPVFDQDTGTVRSESVPGLTRETPQQKRERDISASVNEETGKLLARQRHEIRTEISQKARESRRRIPELQRVQKILEKTKTGITTQLIAEYGRLLPGVDPTNEEVLSTEINSLVLGMLSAFPGAISEGEREFARRTTANIGNTTEANRIIINHMIETLNRAVAEETEFKEFIKGGGTAENFEFSVRKPSNITLDDLSNMSESELLDLERKLSGKP